MHRSMSTPLPAAPWVAFLVLLTFMLRTTAVSIANRLSDEAQSERAFDEFAAKYRRGYAKGSPEYNERFALFRRSLAEVEARSLQPGRRWRAGINAFADRSDNERRDVLGWRPIAGRHSEGEGGPAAGRGSFVEEVSILQEVSWMNLTSARRIYDQGACGSCWAFATASILDAHHEIKYGPGREAFSVQELVSCVPNPRHCGGDGKCKGATVELGMEYAMKYGLSDAVAVPYEAHDGTCHRPASMLQRGHHDLGIAGMAFGLMGYRTLPKNKEEPLIASLMGGPVAVSVGAHGWFPYHGGIFDECPNDVIIDHAVALYGYKAGPDSYWLVRNSWGPDWGEGGYIRLARSSNEDGKCGVDNDPQKGVDCAGGPSQVRVCGACGILYDSVEPHFAQPPEATSLLARLAASKASTVMRREDLEAPRG